MDAAGDVSVTVVGNLAVDRIDYGGAPGSPPSAGGAPSFVAPALRELGPAARILTAAAPRDLPLFAPTLQSAGVTCEVRAAAVSSSFALRYSSPSERTMTVAAIGMQWGPEDVADLTGWVHVAGLLRSDFSAATLATIARNGGQIAFDGQGLVRVPELGPLHYDTAYDPDLLRHVTVLKLSDEEAAVVAGGAFDHAAATALRIPEVIVTHGPAGCDLYLGDSVTHVPPEGPVDGVQPTGAGDMFLAAYVVARARNRPPFAAARHASDLVAGVLAARRDGG